MKPIEPENITRLRDIINALAEHKEATAIRLEVQFTPDSDNPEQAALRLVVTHSLGPKRELELAPIIVQAINSTLLDLKTKVETP